MKTSIFKYDLKFTGISTIWFIAVIDFSFNIKVPHLSNKLHPNHPSITYHVFHWDPRINSRTKFEMK